MSERIARGLGAALWAAILQALSCGKLEHAPEPAPSPSASASASAQAPPAQAASPGSAAPQTATPPPSPCRVLRVRGAARVRGGAELGEQSPLDGLHWIELEANSEVVVRHGSSAREFALLGPGEALACRAGLEQVLLTRGGFRSSRGTGVRPGAELWVATPFASLRYADASLELRVSSDGARVRVSQGRVHADPAVQVRGAPKAPLEGARSELRLHGSATPDSLLAECARSAEKSEQIARELLGSRERGLGAKAAEQLTARRHARAACLIAESALGAEGTRDPRLADQLARANQRWQSIPAATASAAPSAAPGGVKERFR